MECNNLCKHSQTVCEYCQKNYDVSKVFYKAKRAVNDEYVTGYLVKSKAGIIEGILNANNDFNELAFIDKTTIEEVL